MTAAHWIVVAGVAFVAWMVLMWRMDAKFAKSIEADRAEWADEVGDPTRAQIDQALDVIAEPDHRRAEHMNRTLRRVEGGDEHG